MTILRKLRELPYNIMRKFADSHNNTHDFTLLHAGSWLIGRILTICVCYLAWSADWSVLYGSEFNSSHDANNAWWLATLAATGIQILVMVNGSIAVKIAINGLLKGASEANTLGREHAIQLTIHSLLFTAGMIATLYLSFQTDQSAKANAYAHAVVVEEQIKKDAQQISTQHQSANATLSMAYENRKSELIKFHDEQIVNSSAEHRAKIAEKKVKLKRGLVSPHVLHESIARYETRIINSERAPRAAKAKALIDLDNEYKINTQAANTKFSGLEQGQQTQAQTLLTSLQGDIEQNAAATKYRNVALNGIGFLLCVGLLFFARGANRSQPKPTPTEQEPIPAKEEPVIEPIVEPIIKPTADTPEALEAQIRDAILNGNDVVAYNLNLKLLALLKASPQSPPLSEIATFASTDAHSVSEEKTLSSNESSKPSSKENSDFKALEIVDTTPEEGLETEVEWTIKLAVNPTEEEGTKDSPADLVLLAKTETIEAEYDEMKGEDMEFLWENGKPFVQYKKRNGEVVKYDKSRISAQRSNAKKYMEDGCRDAVVRQHYLNRWTMWCNLHEQLIELEAEAKNTAQVVLLKQTA